MRQPIKTVSNEPIEFIPTEHKDLDPKAEKILDRPMIFVGKRITRDQKYTLQEQTDVEYPEGIDMAKIDSDEYKNKIKITGKGKAFKYVWDNCISMVKNVVLEEDGKVEEFEEFTDMARLWNTEGVDSELFQAINFFMRTSELTEEEAKN
jgi:hypothetical protein